MTAFDILGGEGAQPQQRGIDPEELVKAVES